MRDLASAVVVVLGAVNLLAGAYGAWRWWTVDPDQRAWTALRAAQAVTGLAALAAGGLWLAGYDPGDDLFWLYLVLGVPVMYFGEQVRLVSAQSVLDARGLESAQAMEGLPEAEQRSIVVQILRRELGVVAVAALVVAFLALRAYSEL